MSTYGCTNINNNKRFIKDKNRNITWVEYRIIQKVITARWLDILMNALMNISVEMNNHWPNSLLKKQILTSSRRHQQCSKNKFSGINPLIPLKWNMKGAAKHATHSFHLFAGLKGTQRTFLKKAGHISSSGKGQV